MNEGLADDVDAEAEEVLNELNLLTESEDAQNDLRAAGNLDKIYYKIKNCLGTALEYFGCKFNFKLTR
jgi:hypothetical protein